MRHALIVEDDGDALAWMAEMVRAEGYTVATATSLRQARALLVTQQPDILLTDLELPDGHGIELAKDLDDPAQTELVVITGHASVASAVDAVRVGATDYLVKPVDMLRLLAILRRQPQSNDLRHEIGALRRELRKAGRFGQMLGSSHAMQALYERLGQAAPTSATVLLLGEGGTGKSLAARTLHDLSRRRGAPFLVLPASTPPQAAEAELFGVDRGVSSWDRPQRGIFERAQGGTVFIDQVGQLPLDLQQRLLRMLESGSVTKSGSDAAVPVDVRVIASSNVELERLVADGQFRADLHHRLSAFTITLPTLAERASDVQMLAQHFLDRLNQASGTTKSFSPDAMAAMAARSWPGHVRELEAYVRRLYMLSDSVVHAGSTPKELPADADGGVLTISIGTPLSEVERRVTMATLARCGYVKRTAAEVLGISLKTLYNRLEGYAAQGFPVRAADQASAGPDPAH